NAADRTNEVATSAMRDQQSAVRDLQHLVAAPDAGAVGRPIAPALPRLRASLVEAQLEWKQLTSRVEQAERTYQRAAQLTARGFGTPAELESTAFELTHAREERALAFGRRRGAWATELAMAEQRITELRRDVERGKTEHEAYVVTAPVAGTVEELSSLTVGSTVRAGDVVATISPDESLVAYALVPPRDIGRIVVGMPVRLLIEGYDVEVWGAAEGKVTSVSADYVTANDQTGFRVEVTPTTGVLHHPGGGAVMLRKGLRCQARFLVGRRRLVEMLRHRASEWLDPSYTGSTAGNPTSAP
ncbi:MAG: secretion protein HlyD, partial [Gemmatimonadetes bacterium]|nr:secretion protein HlyD [Gemmatimonadota bacterium]